MKKNTFKFFISKAKAIKIKKPYVRKIYPGQSPQKSFPGFNPNEDKMFFDIGFTIPAKRVEKLKKYRFPAELVATGATGYAGARLAQKRRKKK